MPGDHPLDLLGHLYQYGGVDEDRDMRDNAERINVKIRRLKTKMRRGGAHPTVLRRRLRELRKRAS